MVSTRSKHVGIDVYFSLYDMRKGGLFLDGEGSFTRKGCSWAITQKVREGRIAVTCKWLYKEIAFDYYRL